MSAFHFPLTYPHLNRMVLTQMFHCLYEIRCFVGAVYGWKSSLIMLVSLAETVHMVPFYL